jgi:uncharacterized membrane protein
MRSGLLAVGVILLVLGALLYFVQPSTATTTDTTQAGNVNTPTYLTSGSTYNSMYDDASSSNTGYQSQGLDLARDDGYSNTGYSSNCVPMNTYNTGYDNSYAGSNNGLDVTQNSMYNTGYNTGSCPPGYMMSNTGFSNTGYNSWNSMNSGSTASTYTNTAYTTTSDDNMGRSSNFINTADVRASTSQVNGIQVICIYMDEEGNVWPAGDACSDTSVMTAFRLDSDNGYSNTGYNTGSSYTTSSTSNDNSFTNTGFNSSNSTNGSMNNGFNSNTQTGSQSTTTYATAGTDQTTATSTDTTDNSMTTDSTDTVNTGYTTTNTDTTTVNDQSTDSGFVNTGSTTTNTSFFGGSGLRTLAVWMMVIGAILTILGLVLPDAVRTTTARTHGAAGRRVTEEEHVTRRER